MLDPLTTATSCISLINGITSLTLHIAAFVNDVRGARKDMDLISRELTSLSLCLGTLRTDCQSDRVDYPDASRKGIEQALLNIDVLTQQVKDMLQKQSSARLGQRIQWTAQSRDTVDRLRSSLETQKSALEIALQCGSLQILCAMQRQVGKSGRDVYDITDDTEAILGSPAAIPRDAVDITELICQESNALRAEIASFQNAKALSVELREFLVESQLYLRSVTNPFTTPEPSESGLPEARSSIVWTHDMHDNLIDLDISDEDRSTASNPRDRRDAITTNAGPKAMPSFSGLSIGAMIPHRGPVEVMMRYGGLTASHSFSSDMVFSAVMAWAYEELITASKEDRIRLNGIKSPTHVRFDRDGFPFIFYPTEKLSALEKMYGIAKTLELDIPDVYAQALSTDALLDVCPGKLKFQRPYTSEQTETLTLRNLKDAPVAWRAKTTAPKCYCVRPNEGVIPPKGRIQAQVMLLPMKEEPPADAVCKDKKLLQAVVLRPGDDDKDLRKLVNDLDRKCWEQKIRIEFLPSIRNVEKPAKKHAVFSPMRIFSHPN
jgi:hypothetical protein